MLTPLHRRVCGCADQRSVTIGHGTTPHGYVPAQVLDVHPELERLGELPCQTKQIHRLLGTPTKPGALGPIEQSRRAQLRLFCEPRRLRPRTRGSRIARTLASPSGGTVERGRRRRVPAASSRRQVPGSAIDVIRSRHDARERLMGRATISWRRRVIDRSSGQRMDELDPVRTLGNQSPGRLRPLDIGRFEPELRCRTLDQPQLRGA